jgi:hypothetical protein
LTPVKNIVIIFDKRGGSMTKGKAITLAVFTVWPFLYMFIFMGLMATMMVTSFSGSAPPSEPPFLIFVIFPLHFFTMIEIFVMIVIYIVFLFKTDAVPQDKKALWAVVLFLGNVIAMPVFWYIYIWKKLDEA